MSEIDVTIALPEDETPGELIKGYFTLMRAFGWDLYVTCHFALKEDLGKNWFAARISELKDSDPHNWNPRHKFEGQDPGVILRDYVHETDSPYLAVFGNDWRKSADARKILGTRNTWFHFGDDPTAGQLAEAAKTVRAFVASSGMHIGSRIDALVKRVDDIGGGRYVPAAPAPAVSETPVPATEVIEAPEDLARPPIGGTWIGTIPASRYKITRAGDIVDAESMDSVRDRVVGDFDEKFRAWTTVEPRGREVWIDSDGAIGGYIGASPRLLGYLGPDPEGEVARGFFLPRYYVVQYGKVVDLDTDERLSWFPAGNVTNGTSLRITTYGDVVNVDDADGPARIATVTAKDWFPGHLG